MAQYPKGFRCFSEAFWRLCGRLHDSRACFEAPDRGRGPLVDGDAPDSLGTLAADHGSLLHFAIAHVVQGSPDKVADFERLIAALGIEASACSYMGDDLPDLALMRRCGLAVAVANAVDALKESAHYVTRAAGGRGATLPAPAVVRSRHSNVSSTSPSGPATVDAAADVVILGGGVTGLAAGSVLRDRAIVLERDARPGGLVRTEPIDGYWFDTVLHLLHLSDAGVERRVRALMSGTLAPCAPR